MDQKPDFETATATLKRVAPGLAWLPVALRQRLTPAALGSAIVALGISITWLVTAQADIRYLKESSAESKKSVADLSQQIDLLHKIDTQLAVMSNQISNISNEVDRQREWREHVETVAESHTYARRH